MDPSHREIMDFIMWVVGGAGVVCVVVLGFWWKVESGQNKKIAEMQQHNAHQHELIHGKIDKVRDKVEEIWKHLVRRNGGRDL